MSAKLRRFGKYLLVKRVAVGGMGEVHLAKIQGPAGFSKNCAIKILSSSRETQALSLFVEEARIASELNHANIVQVFDFGRVGEDYFICMEFIEGQDLFRLLERCRDKDNRVPLDIIFTILRSVLKGLRYAHQKTDTSGKPFQIIHRDITPQNILLSYEGEVKITDFGIAKVNPALDKTFSEFIQGKYRYLSPEQAEGMRLDPRTDIYSLGIIFYEMLTNRRMFPQNDLKTLMKEVKNPKVDLPKRKSSWIPIEVEAILHKTLKANREERFASADEMLEAINEYCHSEPREKLQNLLSPAYLRLQEGKTPLTGLDQYGGRALRRFLRNSFRREVEQYKKDQEAIRRQLNLVSSPKHKQTIEDFVKTDVFSLRDKVEPEKPTVIYSRDEPPATGKKPKPTKLAQLHLKKAPLRPTADFSSQPQEEDPTEGNVPPEKEPAPSRMPSFADFGIRERRSPIFIILFLLLLGGLGVLYYWQHKGEPKTTKRPKPVPTVKATPLSTKVPTPRRRATPAPTPRLVRKTPPPPRPTPKPVVLKTPTPPRPTPKPVVRKKPPPNYRKRFTASKTTLTGTMKSKGVLQQDSAKLDRCMKRLQKLERQRNFKSGRKKANSCRSIVAAVKINGKFIQRKAERLERILGSNSHLMAQYEIELNRATLLFANAKYDMANHVLNQIFEKLP